MVSAGADFLHEPYMWRKGVEARTVSEERLREREIAARRVQEEEAQRDGEEEDRGIHPDDEREGKRHRPESFDTGVEDHERERSHVRVRGHEQAEGDQRLGIGPAVEDPRTIEQLVPEDHRGHRIQFEEALRQGRTRRGMLDRGVYEENGGDEEQEESERPRMESILLEEGVSVEDGEEQEPGGSEQGPRVRLDLVLDELDREDDKADGAEADPQGIGDPPSSDVGHRGGEEESRADHETRDRKSVHVAASRGTYFKRSPGGLPPARVAQPGDDPFLIAPLEHLGQAETDRVMQGLGREYLDHHPALGP